MILKRVDALENKLSAKQAEREVRSGMSGQGGRVASSMVMTYVELLGVPAAGKSTLARALAEGRIVTLPRASRVGERLRARPDSMLADAAEFVSRYPDLLRVAAEGCAAIPDLKERASALKLFLRTCARQRKNQSEGGVVLVDEGLCQRLLSVLSRVPNGHWRDIEGYVTAMPAPNGVIVVEVAPAVAERRLRERGARVAAPTQRDIGEIVNILRDRGVPTLRVSGDGVLGEAVSAAREFIHALAARSDK